MICFIGIVSFDILGNDCLWRFFDFFVFIENVKESYSIIREEGVMNVIIEMFDL